ncbi:ABC transporter substrate-binding protein [Achromobacter veterisilvae]|uniref:ABC transporter substrate-binding protein n=1 Tax=Achromobacter veterisilvae TaxID=2069367 RepID=A0ABZ2S4A6_9BURK|nr:ABC transporter substrate-binding protein [Achromobacter sp.]MCW0210491.1 ABC transporter substrate-binding protein [Achromobacter sp.]
MKERRMARWASLAGTLLLAVGGSAATLAATADTPQRGGTLRVLDYLGWACLAPSGGGTYANSVISNSILERLVYQDSETAELSPWLAASWKANEDATRYTFSLREGVSFSDGTKLTADIVKANLDQIARGDSSLGIPKWSMVANYDRTEVDSPTQISVYFTRPNVSFPQQLSMPQAGILAPSTLALPYQDQCQGKNLVTTGPFVFVSERPGKEIVYKRRDDYNWAPSALNHPGPAWIDGFVHTIATEGSVRVGTLLAGQADAVRGILPTDEPLVKRSPNHRLEVITANVANQLTVNSSTPNLEDVRVRRALNLATDRNEIKKALLSDSYGIASSVLGRSNPGWVDNSQRLAYDPKGAAALLDEAGWKTGPDGYRYKDGRKLTIPTYISLHHITSQGGFELLAEQWKRVGIDLQLRKADTATYSKVQRDGKVNAFFQTSQIRFDIDALRFTWDSTVGNQANRAIPELDALVRKQNETTDLAVRKRIAAEVQTFVLDNGLGIPLYEDALVYGVSKKVHGIGHEPQGRPYFLTTWLSK